MTAAFIQTLLDSATAPYRSAGHFAWHVARGKLRHDPIFADLLRHGLIPPQVRVLDLGCGQGLLAAWLLSAQGHAGSGQWPADWPAAPDQLTLRGIELMPRDTERARKALGSQVEFISGNICTTDFGQADVVVILDVLHYIDYAAQDDVLLRIRQTLSPAGLLLLRVGDAVGGLPFRISYWVDRVVTFVRGHRNSPLYCRSLADWQTALSKLGFNVSAVPMSQGTPFANVLLVARLGEK